MLTIDIKNPQILEKNSITNNCNYAQLSGVYYNKDGFNKVTTNAAPTNITYDPEKYVNCKVSSIKNGSYVNYGIKTVKKLGENKHTQIDVKSKEVKHSNTKYNEWSTVTTVVNNTKVEDNTDIITKPVLAKKEEQQNKNIVVTIHKVNNNNKRKISQHNSHCVTQTKQNVIQKLTENNTTIVNEANKKQYTYGNSSLTIWSKYVNKIYFLHSAYENQRTISNLNAVGITNYQLITYKTELTFDKLKYYKSIAFLDAINDAYDKGYNSILIIKDDVKFIDNVNIIETFLNESTKHNISILNPNDIATDCLIIRKEAISYIHSLNINTNILNWHNTLATCVLNKYNPYKAPIDICLHLIDYVVPFVDGNDPEWQKIHNKYTVKETGELNTANRFRSWDNFQYVFRCIEQNCKFIDNVYLIVMQESQIPSWVNTKNVHIIYHKDFIPEKHLPCFSSTLIETYMTNIKDISEYFLYGNDDLFVINKTVRKDWFENGLPKIGMVRFYSKTDYFSQNCARSWLLATHEFSNNARKYRTTHGLNGMLRSTGLHLHQLYVKQIDNSASRFRSDKDYNQYLYVDYIYAIAQFKFKSPVSSKYISVINDKSLDKLTNLSKFKLLCLNDCIKNDNLFNNIVKHINNNAFNSFIKKSKYEK